MAAAAVHERGSCRELSQACWPAGHLEIDLCLELGLEEPSRSSAGPATDGLGGQVACI